MDTEETIIEEEQETEPETEVEEPETEEEETPEEPEEVTVAIGDEETPDDEDDESMAPEWVRDLRKKHKVMKRENRELKEKIQHYEAPQQQHAIDPGPKPTLESCDYDADLYQQKYDEWKEAEFNAKLQQRDRQQQQQKASEAWQQSINRYVERKQKLRVKDYDDAEEAVMETLNLNQRGMIVQAADNPELVIYALGKNPKRARELAAITDHVKFAMAIGRLETQLKIKPKSKKSTPPPEKTLSGSGSLAATTDRTLARLRAEAEKTGDYTKVHQYNRERRKKAG